MDDTTRDLLAQIQRMATDTVATPTESERNTMAKPKQPRYTAVMIGAPAPPLPHAAPAPAAEAGTGAEDGGERIPLLVNPTSTTADEALDAMAYAAAEGGLHGDGTMQVAEWHDALAAALDALRGGHRGIVREYTIAAKERNDAITRAEAAEAERDRLSAELAAVRGAMPDAGLLDSAAVTIGFPLKSKARADVEAGVTRELREAAASIRALATATATPPAAEAGTGTGGGAVELHTGTDWCSMLYPGWIILDPDGWRNRGWCVHTDVITLEEFDAAFLQSTILPRSQSQEAYHATR